MIVDLSSLAAPRTILAAPTTAAAERLLRRGEARASSDDVVARLEGDFGVSDVASRVESLLCVGEIPSRLGDALLTLLLVFRQLRGEKRSPLLALLANQVHSRSGASVRSAESSRL